MCQPDEPVQPRAGLYQHGGLLHLPEELSQLRSGIPPQRGGHALHRYGWRAHHTCMQSFSVTRPWWISRCSLSLSADIDECKSTENVCGGHACFNMLGTYRCECEPGYAFNSVTRICEGEEFLWFSYISCILSMCVYIQDTRSMCGNVWVPISASSFVSFCFLDVNECRHYPGRLCAHKCENTLGSYQCSCTTGFKIAADGRNCDGKANI